jgi:hypothetical protein
MKNLIKQAAIALSLTLVAQSLVVIGPDRAQAKEKKQTGNPANAKSNVKRLSAGNEVPTSGKGRRSGATSRIFDDPFFFYVNATARPKPRQ